jgi:hypothetical protein
VRLSNDVTVENMFAVPVNKGNSESLPVKQLPIISIEPDGGVCDEEISRELFEKIHDWIFIPLPLM